MSAHHARLNLPGGGFIVNDLRASAERVRKQAGEQAPWRRPGTATVWQEADGLVAELRANPGSWLSIPGQLGDVDTRDYLCQRYYRRQGVQVRETDLGLFARIPAAGVSRGRVIGVLAAILAGALIAMWIAGQLGWL